MENTPAFLVDLGASFAGFASENPIVLVLCVAVAMAVWRFGGKPARPL